ncbi:MAG: 23S rRNA (guanosine(2251)-2'-O)-methyltransferase RlmB [Defluviitaleaceae bacterium]|nr:23S rRNA (guanosine(2251)-2'-O)-methyltransferase RlmB [Defluviitaleaceae bacterium]
MKNKRLLKNNDRTRPPRPERFERPEREERRERKHLIDYNDGLILEGRNAVLEALNHNKPIDKIYVKKGPSEGSITVIIAKAREKGIVISEVAREKLDYMSQTGSHQGVIASCPAHEYVEISDMLEIAKRKGEDPFIIMLDSITDPHNLGAIMRSADCSGVHGIIIPKRRAVSLTGIVSKTSAGAIEHVPVARVTNLNNAVDELKEAGLWICCAKTHGRPYFKADIKGPIAIIIGSEGEGVSKLLEKKSDFAVSIPMYGEISALNASVAAGLLMYEVVRQRKFI